MSEISNDYSNWVYHKKIDHELIKKSSTKINLLNKKRMSAITDCIKGTLLAWGFNWIKDGNVIVVLDAKI